MIEKSIPERGLRTSSIERAEGGIRRPATAIFGPKVREPQETLQIRDPRAGGSGYSHPYKLFAAEESGDCRLHVWRGACTTNSWAWDDTDVWGTTVEIVPGIGSGSLISEDIPIGDAAAGYLTLTASTTYGIWLMVGALNNFPAASPFTAISGLFPGGTAVNFQTFSFGTAAVHADSTNVDSSDAAAMGLVSTVDSKNLAIYLGKVVVDADGVGTLTQYRRSDVTLHSPLMTAP
jgi:hypothetical protein